MCYFFIQVSGSCDTSRASAKTESRGLNATVDAPIASNIQNAALPSSESSSDEEDDAAVFLEPKNNAGSQEIIDSVPHEKVALKSPEDLEYSAPKFMSLVCVMQMVKLMDAVGILFPHTISDGTQPITSKREFLEQFATAKMSAHIDCPNCKAFVSYRWYANDVQTLKAHVTSSTSENKKVPQKYIPVWFSLMLFRLSAAAVSVIGSANRLALNLAAVMPKRCVAARNHRLCSCSGRFLFVFR
jgi:hypothetical protein